MRQLFADWDPALNRFLDEVKSVDKWKLLHRSEMDNWVNDKSTFVFTGDSCHPMLPYLAQGANSSLEDGIVLGNVLAALRSKDQLPAALRLYEKLRKERGEAIARETFAQRHDFHMDDGPEQEARDELMQSTLGKEIDCKFPSRWQVSPLFCLSLGRWTRPMYCNAQLLIDNSVPKFSHGYMVMMQRRRLSMLFDNGLYDP